MLNNVISVQREDSTLLAVYFGEVLGLYVHVYCLGHAPNNEILAKIIDYLSMKRFSERLPFFKTIFDDFHDPSGTERPKKLLKIHWIEGYLYFFGGNHNVFDVLLNAYQ